MAKKSAARRSSAGGSAPVKVASPKSAAITTSAKPLPTSQVSDHESSAEEDGDLSEEEADEDDDEQGDESEDVTPEALERMMQVRRDLSLPPCRTTLLTSARSIKQLLGDDVDAAELGLLSGMTAEDDDEEEDEDEEDEEEEDEDEDDEDSEDDDDEDVLEEGDSEMIPYEAIRDADQEDIVPVEKTTVNDKVRARLFISHPAHSSYVLTCPRRQI